MDTPSDSSTASNPFRPGAGRVPPELAGRDQLLTDVSRLMDQMFYSPDRGFVAFTVPGMSDFIRRKVLD